MNTGRYTFVIDIPPNFERDVLGGRQPGLQIDVDATAMVQAGLGSGYAQQIVADRNRGFPLAVRGRAAVAGQSRGARRVQPERHDRMVHQRDGDHQQRHHAGDHSAGRGDRARARARHDGPPARHAADAVRNRNVQGLGQRPGDHGGGRPFSLLRGARDA